MRIENCTITLHPNSVFDVSGVDVIRSYLVMRSDETLALPVPPVPEAYDGPGLIEEFTASSVRIIDNVVVPQE